MNPLSMRMGKKIASTSPALLFRSGVHGSTRSHTWCESGIDLFVNLPTYADGVRG